MAESRCEVRHELITTPLVCDLSQPHTGLHYDNAEEVWWQSSAEHEAIP